MSAGNKFCPAGNWTATHQMPSLLGFVVLANVMSVPIRVRWRAFTASPFWYSDGSVDMNPGESKTIPFGIPTAWVQFEVNPPFDALFYAV